MTPQLIQNRKMIVSIGIREGEVVDYDEAFDITFTGKKSVLEIQNSAVISIMNMDSIDRENLLGGFNMWKVRQMRTPFVPISVRIGRDGMAIEDYQQIYIGSIISVSISNPPDIKVQMTCLTSQVDKTIEITEVMMYNMVNYNITTYRAMCEWVSELMGLPLMYQVANPLPVDSNAIFAISQRGYTVAGALGYLQALHPDEVSVFVDDDILVVVDRKDMLKLKPRIAVNVTNGLIGMPNFTEWGVAFQTMADHCCSLAGTVELKSIRNPAVNGDYVVTGVSYSLSTRLNDWYADWTARPPANTNNFKAES